MLIYDLKCDKGHKFEGWFQDINAFERQNKDKKIICPFCESSKIERLFTACAIMTGKRPEKHDREKIPRLQQVDRFIKENFEDVGPSFPEEARKIHYGETEKRNIIGTATPKEEKELREEGVEFFKISLPKYNG